MTLIFDALVGLSDAVYDVFRIVFSGVSNPAPDCSGWMPPEEFYPGGVWPDGSPIEPGAQCGVENW